MRKVVVMLRRQLLKAAGFIPFLSLPKVEAYEYKNDPNLKINYNETDFSGRKHVVIFHKGDPTIVPARYIKDKSQIDEDVNKVYLHLKKKHCTHFYIIVWFDTNTNYLAVYGIGSSIKGDINEYRTIEWSN